MADAATRRAQIHEKAVEGVRAVFPLQTRNFAVEANNVHVRPKDFSSREQKDALLRGNTLQEPLRGDLVLKNNQGKVLERQKNVTLGQVPFFTQRHTFVVDGNEYSVANQRRVRPGVYTRVRGNEELEAAFNLGKGENFRVNMDPAKGHMYLQYGSTNIPLYPVLRQLGVNDRELRRQWGAGVVEQNQRFMPKTDQAVDKLYQRLVPPYQRTAETQESKAREIAKRYRDTMLDPDVTERTLGQRFSHVNPQALVQASKKILDVHRRGVDTDDRDSLAYQTLHGVDDFIRERIQLEGRNLARKVRVKATAAGARPELQKIVPVSPFTRTLRSFVTGSSLAAIPTQINPVEIIDSAVRITSLGEGGIGSERAVPSEARRLHHTHFGIIDPSRTPESFRAGIDLRAAAFTKRDAQGRIHTLMRNARTGKLEDVPVQKLESATIAFAGETKKKTGVSALRNGNLVSVSRNEIDYELPHPAAMFSPATNTVPFPEGMQGNRLLMGAKMATQALPLIEREEPLVQVQSFNANRTFEEEIARMVTPHAPVAGVVKKVDKDYIYIQPEQQKTGAIVLRDDPMDMAPVEHVLTEGRPKLGAAPLIKVPYETNFPLASKTYLHNNVKVKAGDRVTAQQHLTDSNFTKDGKLALGKNMNVGFLAYYGHNTNDAVVISDSAAQKLTATNTAHNLEVVGPQSSTTSWTTPASSSPARPSSLATPSSPPSARQHLRLSSVCWGACTNRWPRRTANKSSPGSIGRLVRSWTWSTPATVHWSPSRRVSLLPSVISWPVATATRVWSPRSYLTIRCHARLTATRSIS
jgi:DNA-directed RNA polymerase subunit beta